MKRLFGVIGSTLGSSFGWWLGSGVGVMTSFMLSMLGLGAGLWLGVRIARHFEG